MRVRSALLAVAALCYFCVVAVPDIKAESVQAGDPVSGWTGRTLLKRDDVAAVNGTDEECCGRLEDINFSSNLPVVIVDTDGVGLTRDKVNASLCTCSTLPKGDYNGQVQISLRGGDNTQQYNVIDQYAIKLPDTSPFLSMPSRKNWILHGQSNDSFGFKYWLGFNVSRGTGEYTPATQHAEVFMITDNAPLNYDKHYQGIRLGFPKLGQGDHMVDVAKNSDDTAPQDGGYILEWTHGQPEGHNYTILTGPKSNKPWEVHYPEDPLPPNKEAFIQGALSDYEGALYGPDFADPRLGWRNFANETTFLDWFIVTEIVKNAKHGYHSTVWMSKNATGLLSLGPEWGLVQGWGTCCGYPVTGYLNNGYSQPGLAGGSGISPNGWLFNICEQPERCSVLDGYDPGNGLAVWFTRLWQDDAWRASAASRYAGFRGNVWSAPAITAKIASIQEYLQQAGPLGRTLAGHPSTQSVNWQAAERHLQRWNDVLRQPQYYATPADQINGTFTQVQDWLLTRLGWLDQAFPRGVSDSIAFAPFPAAFPPSTGSTETAG